jgi:hypothetical protein
VEINILYMVPHPTFKGGDAAFTVHLVKSLVFVGHKPRLLRVVNGGKLGTSMFCAGIGCERILPAEAIKLARNTPTIVAYCFAKHMGSLLQPIIMAGGVVVINSKYELPSGDVLRAMKISRRPVLAIRKSLASTMRNEMGLDARFIGHPYLRTFGDLAPRLQRTRWAVSMTRIDFAKKTEHSAVANRILAPSKRIQLWGDINRMYAHHTLDKKHPGWRECYHGVYAFGEAPFILRDASWAIDMTTWVGDSGGSQYCFLEAWDAGAALVINKKWSNPKDEMAAGRNCLAAADGIELARLLQLCPPREIIERGEMALAAHSPDVIVPQYIEALS